MKTAIKLLITCILVPALMSCQQQEEPVSQGRVTFSLNLASESRSAGRSASLDFPEGAYLAITITALSGDVTQKELSIYKMGERYVSDPIELASGQYNITDFQIFANENEVIYATPKTGSPLAQLVTQPLPIYFQVKNNELSNVIAEVISTTEKIPEDFGYASFGVTLVATPQFQLSVFAPGEDDLLELVSAQAIIVSEGDAIVNTELVASINSMKFLAAPYDTCTLLIRKNGFAPYHRSFTLAGLQHDLDGGALKVVLKKAFTFISAPRDYGSGAEFLFTMRVSSPDDFVIDWGDGSSETLSIERSLSSTHQYANSGDYFVSITGDLTKITSAVFAYSHGSTSNITTDHLSELSSLNISYTGSASSIDVSRNRKLKYLGIANSQITELDISNNRQLNHLDISYTRLSGQTVERLINDLLIGAIENNIQFGIFNYEDDSDLKVVGPPAGDAYKQKLLMLERSYYWDIYPFIN